MGDNNMGGSPKIVLVYDTDPSIDYHGSWALNSTNTIENKKQVTLTSHSAYKSNSSITYIFNGTQIKVIGEIPAGQGPVIANYTIDGGRPKCRTEPTLSQNESLPNQMLFLSDILYPDAHTLTIDVLETGVDRNYTFQSFHVTKPQNESDSNHNKNEMMKDMDNKDKNNHGPNVGAIVGGILGAVIFLILVFFGVFFYWRKKRLARISSNNGQNPLPPMMYYAQSVPNGSPRAQGLYVAGPGSYIDTDSKFTFPIHREAVDDSRQSWVSINMPPSIPQSAIMSGPHASDWPSYNGSSLAVQQSHAEQSRFSPYTATFTPMVTLEPVPLPVPRRNIKAPLQIDTLTRTSKSSLARDGAKF